MRKGGRFVPVTSECAQQKVNNPIHPNPNVYFPHEINKYINKALSVAGTEGYCWWLFRKFCKCLLLLWGNGSWFQH